MKTWKIIELGIETNYGFYNGWYMIFEIWKRRYYWNAKKSWLIEKNCMELWIYSENDMQKLANKKFNILDIIELEGWWAWYEIELVNKKINPDSKSIWIYDDSWIHIN